VGHAPGAIVRRSSLSVKPRPPRLAGGAGSSQPHSGPPAPDSCACHVAGGHLTRQAPAWGSPAPGRPAGSGRPNYGLPGRLAGGRRPPDSMPSHRPVVAPGDGDRLRSVPRKRGSRWRGGTTPARVSEERSLSPCVRERPFCRPCPLSFLRSLAQGGQTAGLPGRGHRAGAGGAPGRCGGLHECRPPLPRSARDARLLGPRVRRGGRVFVQSGNIRIRRPGRTSGPSTRPCGRSTRWRPAWCGTIPATPPTATCSMTRAGCRHAWPIATRCSCLCARSTTTSAGWSRPASR
jgi:hypothetical protein